MLAVLDSTTLLELAAARVPMFNVSRYGGIDLNGSLPLRTRICLIWWKDENSG
mgnify:CR=1 FL=1